MPPSLKLKLRRGHDPDKEIDALSLKKSVENTVRAYHDLHLPQALRNERWLHGEHWSEQDQNINSDDDIHAEWDVRLPKVHHNLLRNHSMTWAARLIEMKPIGKVYPLVAAGARPMVAEVGNKLLEHYRKKWRWNLLWQRACMLAQPHSCAGFKTYWDPRAGDELEDGTREGDLVVEVVPCTDYGTDGSQDASDSKWAYFAKNVDKDDAYEMMRDAGYSHDAAYQETLAQSQVSDEEMYLAEGALDEVQGQVPVCEIWWEPSARFPNGLVLGFVRDNLVVSRELPYDHEQHPLTVFKVMERRQWPYGSTHFTDAVPIQRMYNELESIRSKRFWEFRNTWVVADANIIAQIEAGDLLLKNEGNASGQAKRPIQVVDAPPHLEVFDVIEAGYREKMADVFGVTDQLSTGAVDPKTAGKTVAFVNQLARMKLKEPLEMVFVAVERICRQALQIIQQMMDEERLLELLGPGYELAAQAFLEADLQEYLIWDPVAGDEFDRPAQATETQSAILEGAIDPVSGAEMVETGLPETASEAHQVQLITQTAMDALEGQAVQPDPTVRPDIAVRELFNILQANREHQYADVLEQMIAYFLQAGSGQPQQAPPQPTAPQQEQQLGPGGIPVPGVI